MEKQRIARILYNMSLDMDYADYIEYAEEEISCIAMELQVLQDNNCDSLLQALEIIAMQNEGMEFWKEK
jgi:hypothetical protein